MRYRAPAYAVLLSFLCLTIHELGHVAAGLWFGGEVREFVLLSAVPHVQLAGAFSARQESWIAVAGSASELLLFGAAVAMGSMLAVEVTGVFACVELVGWTLAALAYPHGPHDNDASDFLAQTGLSGWWLAAACLVLGSMVWTSWRMRSLAPMQRRFEDRNGEIPVRIPAEEVCYAEMFAGGPIRPAGRSAVAGNGADTVIGSERSE